ncbi:unnamed protein product [Rotaria socialis]|uniref:Peptidase S1 domain-containing protein n=3 Tax=Rotaria socialis TaxID=392032 RepID=A0A821ETH5_9BILA|nr:unnamed protein product [Rotaria socialis]CAF3303781.1 unnamed protein product [Rotaria socialis]CAF3427890.1 unnamed protein product [Rotaria socialis]CAF3752975.1 unnamed protein product [Rotaria socialis]CAF4211615.1 unnamed protein product [Rotaria socialis]
MIPSYLSSCVPSSRQCGCSVVQPNTVESKIVDGYMARNNSWPWIVSLRRGKANDPSTVPGFSFCVGSLISSKYVLTAAHCFATVSASQLRKYFVVIGAVYINDTNEQRYKIKTATVHPNYNATTYGNDIALLELQDHVDFSDPRVGFICLPPNSLSTYPSEPLIGFAVGWGLLTEGGLPSYTLQQVELPIISDTNKFCQNLVADDAVQFCAGYLSGTKDTCQGDSGGPLMILDKNSGTWIAAGITSYGYGCAEVDRPGVYTRVSMYRDWIDTHINSAQPQSRASTKAVPSVISLLFSFLSFLNI